MKCPFCRADEKLIKTYETVQHRSSTERRKYCTSCSSAWKTIEEVFDKERELCESGVTDENKKLEKAAE